MKTAEQWVAENSQSGPFDLVEDGEQLVREIQADAIRESARASSALLPAGSPCSIYNNYALRVEVYARGTWHADSNWHEDEIGPAYARVHYLRLHKRPDAGPVRLIRIRFEVLPDTKPLPELTRPPATQPKVELDVPPETTERIIEGRLSTP